MPGDGPNSEHALGVPYNLAEQVGELAKSVQTLQIALDGTTASACRAQRSRSTSGHLLLAVNVAAAVSHVVYVASAISVVHG